MLLLVWNEAALALSGYNRTPLLLNYFLLDCMNYQCTFLKEIKRFNLELVLHLQCQEMYLRFHNIFHFCIFATQLTLKLNVKKAKDNLRKKCFLNLLIYSALLSDKGSLHNSIIRKSAYYGKVAS